MPNITAAVVILALDRLATSEGIPGTLAYADALELARNPDYPLFPGSARLLQRYGLLETDGRMHDQVRETILTYYKG